jgi:acyl-CoA synthetase (NDP forming)
MMSDQHSALMAASSRVSAMFEPKSVAVIGASAGRSFATNILANLKRWGFKGPIHPVNPNYASVLDLPCYASLKDVPGPIDLVIVGVGSSNVPRVLDECEAKRVRAVCVVSSGFADMGGDLGRQRQVELADWARRTGIVVNGPNCLGLMNAHTGMVALPTPFQNMRAGGVSAVVQSGMLAPSLLMPLLARDIGLRCIVSTGNEVDAEATDYLAWLIDDDQTKVIACYAEQIKSPEKFIAVCEHAARRQKPIVMIKAGRSEGASRAALAHTGSLVGSDNVIDALLGKLGVTRVDTIDDMIECIASFHAGKLPRGDRVAVVSPSGGVSSLISDLVQPHRVSLPQPTLRTAAALKEAIPEFGAVGNPLDITGQSVFNVDILKHSLHALAESGEYDIIVWVRDFPAGMDRASPVGQILEDAARRYADVTFLVSSIVGGHMFRSLTPELPIEDRVTSLCGVPFLQGTAASLVALSALIRYADFLRGWAQPVVDARVQAPALKAAAARLGAAKPGPMTEHEGKQVLAMVGLTATHEVVATSPGNALSAAIEIGGAVALKIDSPDIMHKTDAGCVLLDLQTPQEITRGYATVMANARAFKADCDINGVLVQEMVGEGVDVIVGMTRDAQFGPVLVLGLGGIWVEILKDVQYLVPPVSERAVRDALARLRGTAMFSGVRGRPPADVEALVDAVLRFGELLTLAPESLVEIEINPLRVLPVGQGVRVLDALLVIGESETATEVMDANA